MCLGEARRAAAFTACTAAQVIAQEPNCPNNTSTCIIRSTVVTPTDQNCTFDFGTRDVVIGTGATGGSGKLQFGSRMVALKAGSLTVNSNGLIEGLGNAAAPNNFGGMISIDTSRGVSLLGTANTTLVDLRASLQSGVLAISAVGNVNISGKVDAGNLPNTPLGSGGEVRITTSQNLTVSGLIRVSGGIEAASGGLIDMKATGRVDLTGSLEFIGSDGGQASIEAGGEVVVATLTGNATGDAGSGGTATIAGTHGVRVTGTINLRGNGSDTGSGGGGGGFLAVDSQQGVIRFEGNAFAEGAGPDGGGGDIDFAAGGDILVGLSVASPTNQISSSGNGTDSCGGGLSLDSARDIDIRTSGRGNVSGGANGGELSITAERDIFVRGRQNAAGREVGAPGGYIAVEAGETTTGNIEVRAQLDTNGGGCSMDTGCGGGGAVDLGGCNITVFSGGGEVRANGPDGGNITIAARRLLTVSGPVSATRNVQTGVPGTIQIFHSNAMNPVLAAGQVLPSPPSIVLQPACTNDSQTNCLVPCPTCGNGVIEYPEGCDTSGTPVSCDGCSQLCLVEDCNDGFTCTTDTCDPSFGCINTDVPLCIEPTFTPSISPTRTITRTPTRTNTASPTRTRTPTPPCAGDCDRNHAVAPAEVQRLLSIMNLCDGNANGCAAVPGDDKQCTAADVDGNGVISARELARVLRNVIQFPGGCQP